VPEHNKGASARLATYGLRLAMPGGSVLPRKAANLTDQSFRRKHAPAPGRRELAGKAVVSRPSSTRKEPMLTFTARV